MENQFADVFHDKEISEMRERLSKRPDILKEYDNVIQKIANNEFGQSLISEMHRLLGLIIGDISAGHAISYINNTENFILESDSKIFAQHKMVMTLFCYINLCIVEKIN